VESDGARSGGWSDRRPRGARVHRRPREPPD
jgi:hypothetical protein